MWRKQNETKPSGQHQDALPPVRSKPQVIQVAQPSPLAVAVPEQSTSQNIAPIPVTAPVVPKTVMSTTVAPLPSPTSVSTPVSTSTSVISAGLKIRGEISGSSDLYIEGEAHGKIRLVGGRVSVGPKGNVQADVDAREIVVEGLLQGNLKASESVRLGPSSRVQGSVIAPRIGIEDGARLSGKVEMVRANDSQSASAALAETESPTKTGVIRGNTAGAEGRASHA